MNLNKRAIRFTRHALKRCVENNITIKELLAAWDNSEPYNIPLRMESYKFSVYGLEALDDFYMYDYKSHILFTCHKKVKHQKGFTVVITLTKKIIQRKTPYSK
jgi:hypothetical protein